MNPALSEYYGRLVALFPALSAADRQDLGAWTRRSRFHRMQDWPGWAKHLGSRPAFVVKKQPRPQTSRWEASA